LTTLLVCSLASISSSLVTGRIQGNNAPRGWDTTCNLQEDNAKGAATASQDGNVNVNGPSDGNDSDSDDRQIFSKPNPANFKAIEEKDRRELEWIVRNSSKVLGAESPPLGEMGEGLIQLTYELMKAWARRASKKESKAPHVVERLLRRLLTEQDAGNDLIFIDTSIYNMVLDGWSNSSEEGSAERSEEILLQMERMYKQGNEHVKPNEGSYNAVVKAYVKNGNRLIAAPKAEAIVRRMEQSEDDVSPNRRSYNLLLYALANSSLEDAASHAEETLHKMLKRYFEDGDETCKPDINSFNQVLGAWARGKQSGFEDSMQSIFEELMELPKEMGIRPNTDTFNAVMGGWLKSDRPKAILIIEQTLKKMEHNFQAGNVAAKPDRITINTLTAAYAKNGSSGAVEKSIGLRSAMEKKYQVKPDAISHNIVVDSWCKSGRADAPGRVMELLDNMERDFKGGKLALKPDGYTYSSVIGCFVKFNREDAPQKAEEILERMQDLYLNYGGDPVSCSVYNAVINAWASSDSEDALGRVKELLQIMEENDGEDEAIPKANRITYNTVIKAMRDGTKEDAAYAEGILTILETKGQTDFHLLPDSYSYTSVITAYGRSDAENKAVKSLEILKRIILACQRGNMAAIPTTHSFNAALNACAFVEGDEEKKKEAFEIAVEVYSLLQKHGTPDHTTYGTLLRACATLLHPADKNREKMVDDIFHKACENGGVGRLVITQMKFACTPHQHIRLVGRDLMDRINVKDLPRAWSRNVRETSRRTG
jgi:hypothetical protein